MKKALVTGSAGLIGSEAVKFFTEKGYLIVGIDNDMRKYFFGEEASTRWNIEKMKDELGDGYIHYDIDIRDSDKVEQVFKEHTFDIIIHTAAQPSHDWAANDPVVDFDVNARATLLLLENCRKYSPKATFIYTSTNKVYGDTPNKLPLVELENRYEIAEGHQYSNGIDENMSIDHTTHSVFGASKVAGDVMVQEYGRYFGINTGVFRGGCLTGPAHSGAQLHGFLSYLVKSIVTGKKYTIFGYKGKQVRDNIHAHDLINMFWSFHNNPRPGEVYNAGGGRHSNVSMLEAIDKIEKLSGKKAIIEYSDKARVGDHIWYVSDLSKFKSHYPEWEQKYNLDDILSEMVNKYDKKERKVAFVCPFNLNRLTGTPIRTKTTINSVKLFSNVKLISTSSLSGRENVEQIRIGKFSFRSLDALRDYKPDIVHGVSTLSIISIFLYKIFFNWNVKTVFEIHGWSWYELEGKASLLKRFIFLLIDIFGFVFSTGIVSMSFSQKNFLMNNFWKRKKVSVIWGAADFEVNHQPAPERDTYKIGYIGNNSFWQGLPAVLEAASLLESEKGVMFELAGFDYSDKKKFPTRKNIKYIGRVAREDVRSFIIDKDIMISSRVKGAVSDLQYPQKISEYLAAGRPVIVSDTSDQKIIIDRAKCGYVLSSVDGESISKAIKQFISLQKADRDGMSNRAADFAEKEMSLSVYEEKLRSLYYSL